MEETKREPSPVAPEFTDKIENQSLTEGDKLILKCAVRGIPDPTVEWFVNGQVSLVPTLKIEQKKIHDSSETLGYELFTKCHLVYISD